jgi:hypothetical protein
VPRPRKEVPVVVLLLLLCPPALCAEAPYPPVLPGGKQVVTDRDPAFLEAPVKLRPGVSIAEIIAPSR